MLKAYAFDVDSNLVFTDSTIWIDVLENGKRIPKEISQLQYEEFWPKLKKWDTVRYANNNAEQSMRNFRGPGKFERDIFSAISQWKFWPSRDKFIEANRYASPLAIITARGHPVHECKETHKKIIYDVFTSHQRDDLISSMKERLGNYKTSEAELIDIYLDNNFYAPCSEEMFLASIDKDLSYSMSDRKNAAFEQFVLHTKEVFKKYYGANFLAKRKIRIGFSDDTHSNITWLHNFIHTPDIWLMRKYPEIKFRLYDTTESKFPPIKFSYTNNNEE